MRGMVVLVLCLFAAVVAQEPVIHKDQPENVVPIQKSDRGSVTVKEFLIDSDVEDIKWTSQTNEIVFVRSALGTIYRSPDHGRTWEYQMSKLKKSLLSEGGDGKIGVADMFVSEANRDYIFLQGHGSTHWITRDAGATYEALTNSLEIKQLVPHKTNPEWMLASRWSSGCTTTGVKQNCSIEVHMSLNFGRSWTFIDSYVAQFGWGRPQKPEEIFIVKYEKKDGNQRFGAWDKEADFFKSDDLWKTHTKFIPRGNRFLLLDKYLFVAVVSADKENEVQLVVAKDDVSTYQIARLPFDLKEHSYTILDTSEGAVFLHVNHGDFQTPYGSIYLSDGDGWRYSLSLRNNRHDTRGRCDFEKVQGLDGIYIANYVENPESVGDVVTVMTFDKGGRWARIKAPAHDAVGKETNCNLDENCSLHLHGITGDARPFRSTKTALGLIMANGNIGKYLDLKHRGNTNTYFSRDAGQSWLEVRKGSHIYEFGDHGGLIVMAKDHEPTNEVLFTWNEGISWTALPLPGVTDVDNIITEPNSTSPSFVLYGSRRGVGVLIHLDFSSVHMTQCQGIEAAGKPDSSYELWSPNDSSSKCLLGRKVHYTRRKRAEECYNGELYERQLFMYNCECTEEDFECDFGYERQGLDGACVAIRAVKTEVPATCYPGSQYYVSKGYRRVPGDTCDAEKGINLLPEAVSCPVFGQVSSGGWTVLVVMFLLAAALFVATYLSKDPEAIEKMKAWFASINNGGGYKKLKNRPEDTFSSDDEFDLGAELLEPEEKDLESLQDTNLNDFSTQSSSHAFGPLPMSSNFEESTPVPVLQPPPQAPGTTDFTSLGDDE